MHNSEMPEFLEIVYVLESWYRVSADKRMSDAESVNYFRQLSSFPLSIVSQSAERIPSQYPSFFPKAGEWRVVCEAILSEMRFAEKERDNQLSQSEFLRTVHCAHEFVEEKEPEGSFFVKFDVCLYCGLAKPTINRAPHFQKQVNYLAAAMRARA